jgi:hypothetical protein
MKRSKIISWLLPGVILGIVVLAYSTWLGVGLSHPASSSLIADPPNSVSVTILPQQVQVPAGGSVAYQMSFATLSVNTLTITPTLTLVLPDGTRKSASAPAAFQLRSSRVRTFGWATNLANYTDQTGNFVLECQAVDQSGAMLGRYAFGFTVGAESREIRFEDNSDRAGVRVTHHPDPTDPVPHGTGVAMADYDQDGWLDIYVTDRVGPNHLFHNNHDGTFTDVAAGAGVADPQGFGGGCAFADYDNDGYPDLYVGNFDNNALFHNNGDGTFTEVTAAAGVQGFGRSESVSWGDYDRDGFVDIYVANHNDRRGSPAPYPNPLDRDYLYHNNGDGTFTDVTYLLPDRETGDDGYGFIAGFLDYDNDGDPDIYLVIDALFRGPVTPNHLWRNDGPDGHGGWKFTNVAAEAHADLVLAGMGLGVGDYNRDGNLDMYFSHYGPAVLLSNNGDGTFSQIQNITGVSHGASGVIPMVNWGCEFADFDNDGWEDLYICAGWLDIPPYQQPNALYKNNGDGTFTDIGPISGTADPNRGRSAAMGDLDNDGFVDIYLGNYDGPSVYFHNLGNQNHWLTVEARGTISNRSGIGARVTIFTPDGVRQIREIRSGSSLGAGSEVVAHFGLGNQTQINRLEIRWPSGQMQPLENIRADQKIIMTEPRS